MIISEEAKQKILTHTKAFYRGTSIPSNVFRIIEVGFQNLLLIEKRENWGLHFVLHLWLFLFIGMIKNEFDIKHYNDGFNNHSFNQLLSDRIGPQTRVLPDTRPDM